MNYVRCSTDRENERQALRLSKDHGRFQREFLVSLIQEPLQIRQILQTVFVISAVDNGGFLFGKNREIIQVAPFVKIPPAVISGKACVRTQVSPGLRTND